MKTLIAYLTIGMTALAGQTLSKRLIGDYGFWSRTQTPPYSSAQIPFNKLTHINHAGLSFVADGSLVIPTGFLEPELITKAHAAGVKVLLLLGGDFTGLETTSGGPQALVGNLKNFASKYHYDGVDIDWEYPSSPLDATTFVNLLSGLRAAFPGPDFVLSAYVAPWGGSGYAFGETQQIVDYFNILMYDCAGPWTDDGQLNSPLFPDPNNPEPYECSPGGSVEAAVNLLLNEEHVPAQQLTMGTPFYGYVYENVSELFGPCVHCGNTVLSENYGTFFKQRINRNGWKAYLDPYALVPYMLRIDGKAGYGTYDDPTSTYNRIWYSVWERGLGGSFMWSLDADYDGHSQDLLDAMYSATLAGSK
jgi:chitinase